MTELTPYQPGAITPADFQERAVQRLGEWAQSARAAYTVAQQLVQSSFVPAAFHGKPIEATAAILAGMEVGLQPMAALKSFDIIQGQAAPRALTLRAIVQSHGHEMVLVESTNTRCVMRGRRKGDTAWQESRWTIDRAKDLGLTGKDNWKKQPAAMLVARATSELARLIAADAILGIGYSVEEIQDGELTTAPESTPDPAPRSFSRRKPEPIPEEPPPEPSLDEGPPPPEPEPESAPELKHEPGPAPNPDGITKPQLGKMGALMKEAGLIDRDQALMFVSSVIGREITSRNEMSKREASAVIEELQKDAAPPPEPTFDEWSRPVE